MDYKKTAITIMLMVVFVASVFAGAAKERSEIPDIYKWKTQDIYATLDDWQKDFDFISEKLDELAAFKGTFAGEKATEPAQSLIEFNRLSEQISIKFERVWTYVMYNYNTDLSNSDWIGKQQMLYGLWVNYGEKLAWMDPEILEIPYESMMKYIDATPELEAYRKTYDDLYKQQEHVLTEPEESILALSGNITGTSSDVFGQLTDADMKFGYILDENGDSVEVTDAGWVTWRTNMDRRVREDYFKAVWDTYDSFGSSISALMNGNIKKDMYLTRARKYESTLHRAMDGSFVPVEVYYNLIETTRANAAPFHKYNEIRKRVLGVDNYRHWDYYVSIIGAPEKRYNFEEAVDMITEALKPMGKQYIKDIKYGLNPKNGWVDVYTHTGKRGGAYSSMSYGIHPFMLYNFDYDLGLTFEDVSTVAHEVGHSMHSWYSEKTQPFPNKDYAIFNAEVASTVNEAIFSNLMLAEARKEYNKAKGDAKEEAKQWLIFLLNKNIDAVRQTFYRQTLFATWEWEAHKMGEEGMPLTKQSMSDLYGSLLAEFHGSATEYEELSHMSWARIPHFYRGYYVYTYATSYAAAIAIAQDILAEYNGDKNCKGTRDRFLTYLASGSSKHPVELLKDAGVDMTTPEPILALIQYFSDMVDELDALTQ